MLKDEGNFQVTFLHHWNMTDKTKSSNIQSKINFMNQHLTSSKKALFLENFGILFFERKQVYVATKQKLLSLIQFFFGWFKDIFSTNLNGLSESGLYLPRKQQKRDENVHKKLKQLASFNHDWCTKSMLMCYHKIAPYQMWGRWCACLIQKW